MVDKLFKIQNDDIQGAVEEPNHQYREVNQLICRSSDFNFKGFDATRLFCSPPVVNGKQRQTNYIYLRTDTSVSSKNFCSFVTYSMGLTPLSNPSTVLS